MAKKWAVEEDYIVCRFYLEHIDSWRDHMEEVMAKMEQAGFGVREQKSVRMRIQNYEFLHTKQKGLSNYAKQSLSVYNAFLKRGNNAALYQQIQEYIQSIDVHSADVHSGAGIDLSEKPGSMTAFVYTEPLGPSFRDVLFGYIDSRGLKDSDVYKSCYVGRDTFAHIRKGDKGVSKRTVMQLCFGLKLSYEEAIALMASAGFAFSANNLTDAIVAYYLKHKMHDIHDVNITLYDSHAELLF